MLATERTLLRMFLNIWRQLLFPRDLHDTALQNFCTIECGTTQNCAAYFYSITGRIQLDSFDRSVYSQCAPCNKTWLKFQKAFCVFSQCYMSNVVTNNNYKEYDCSMESLLLRCNKSFHFCSRIHITFLLINF